MPFQAEGETREPARGRGYIRTYIDAAAFQSINKIGCRDRCRGQICQQLLQLCL